MTGERDMIRAGYCWDIYARFPCNASGVRVGTRKTKRGALRAAERFGKLNRVPVTVKLRHDPLLDEWAAARCGTPGKSRCNRGILERRRRLPAHAPGSVN